MFQSKLFSTMAEAAIRFGQVTHWTLGSRSVRDYVAGDLVLRVIGPDSGLLKYALLHGPRSCGKVIAERSLRF